MTERNRVTPFGEILAIEQTGTLMGNRGCIHHDHDIVRPWQVRRWIACALEYRGNVAPKWEPNRWTALFFWDEAVALAAGHRPCALCRRDDYRRWCQAWDEAFGERVGVDAMDRVLHAARVTPDHRQQRHRSEWEALPDGAFVSVDGQAELVWRDQLVRWKPEQDGYGVTRPRPTSGSVEVLTPAPTLDVLHHGYVPSLHPTMPG